MNFDFSDEQKELKDQAKRFLSEQCGPTVVRNILESDEPFARDLWKQVAEMGFTGTAIPEEYGGIGYGYLELCLIAQELGRVAAPIPFSSSVYLAAEALIAAGSEEQKQQYLTKIASGEAIGTVAVAEGPLVSPTAPSTTLFENGKLTGTKIPVPDGDVADFAIVLASAGSGGPATLALVDLNADGVLRSAIETIDPTRSHGKLTFDGAAAEPLGDSGAGAEILDTVFNRAAVLFAFEQLGGADFCLGMARQYATERFAFGRAIGSFQAIKHRLADMYMKNELARSNCYFGAWALSTDAEELPTAAAGARISATQAYHFASKENIQIHGGMGFTWEFDCHFYYRRAKLLALNLGSESQWKDKLLSQLEIEFIA
ncbi:MAG: acyl-CoA/acyl-ACP dehydrogenase [Candidatus Hydrogenedentes bacterium]|nr:acyl-CoA/acyl-ACP dehydrogenase [Candidatus Hydrogenedentota bacterium]